MKKLLLSLGAIASVAAPVAAVVACTTEGDKGDGFTAAPLITGFKSLADESQTAKSSYKMEFEGKQYSDEDEFVNVIEKNLNEFLATCTSVLSNNHYDIAKINKNNGIYTIEYTSKADNSHIGTSPDHGPSIKNIAELVKTIKSDMNNEPMSVDKWEDKGAHQFSAEPVTNLSPLRNSFDSIIYSEAQSLTRVIATNENKITLNDGTKAIDLVSMPKDTYTDLYQNPSKGAFKKGDNLKIVFKNESDMASFSQRFAFIDGQANGFNSEDVLRKSEKMAIINGQILSIENGTADESTSLFKLDVTAKNEVEITFLNPKQSVDPNAGTGQFLYLNGFTDINKDGKIDVKDQTVAGPYTFN